MSLCSLVRRLKQTQHHLDICTTQWTSEMLLFNLLHKTKTEALVATRDQRKPCVTVRKRHLLSSFGWCFAADIIKSLAQR